MRILTLFGLVAVSLTFSSALRCWHCENQRSLEACSRNGRLRRCQSSQGACETVVRRNDKKLTYFKHCKQRKACANNQLQSTRRLPTPRQCNGNDQSSTCYCCCYRNGCGKNTNDCTERIRPTPTREIPSTPTLPPEPVCNQPPVFEDGEVECGQSLSTGDYALGSRCQYDCGEGLSLGEEEEDTTVCQRANPDDPFSTETVWFPPPPECRGSPARCASPPIWEEGFGPVGIIECEAEVSGGGWNLHSICKYSCPADLVLVGDDTATCDFPFHDDSRGSPIFFPFHPCCKVPCKSTASYVLFLLDQSNSIGQEAWRTVTSFVANAMRAMQDTSPTMVGVVVYGSIIDVERSFEFSENTELIQERVQNMDYVPYPKGTDTLGALFHALQMVTENEAIIPGAQTYVVVITDGESDTGPEGEGDLLPHTASILHQTTNGVFAFGVNVPKSNIVLRTIASTPSYVGSLEFTEESFIRSLLLLREATASAQCELICTGPNQHVHVPEEEDHLPFTK